MSGCCDDPRRSRTLLFEAAKSSAQKHHADMANLGALQLLIKTVAVYDFG
jgi:hypothetical protein